MPFLNSLSKVAPIKWGEIGVRACSWFAAGFVPVRQRPGQTHSPSIASLIGF